jgi:hypothetical protein
MLPSGGTMNPLDKIRLEDLEREFAVLKGNVRALGVYSYNAHVHNPLLKPDGTPYECTTRLGPPCNICRDCGSLFMTKTERNNLTGQAEKKAKLVELTQQHAEAILKSRRLADEIFQLDAELKK